MMFDRDALHGAGPDDRVGEPARAGVGRPGMIMPGHVTAPPSPPAAPLASRGPRACAVLGVFLGVLLGVLPSGGGARAEADAAPCPDRFATRGLVAAVNEAGDLVLADGGVLRLAGLAADDTESGRVWRAALAGRAVEVAGAGNADRYGRQPGLVRLAGESRTLQEEMLARGLAAARPEQGVLGCIAAWTGIEAPARRARRGIWAEFPLDARDIAAIRARQGRFTIIAGRVLSVGNRRRVDYLNFGPVWRQDMTGRIAPAARIALDARGTPPADLAGRRVTLRGTVLEAGGPAIDLRWAEQIAWDARAGEERQTGSE